MDLKRVHALTNSSTPATDALMADTQQQCQPEQRPAKMLRLDLKAVAPAPVALAPAAPAPVAPSPVVPAPIRAPTPPVPPRVASTIHPAQVLSTEKKEKPPTAITSLYANNWKSNQGPKPPAPLGAIPPRVISTDVSPASSPQRVLSANVAIPTPMPSAKPLARATVKPVPSANLPVPQDASSGNEDNGDDVPFHYNNTKIPDTSSTHIAALTSPNWVEACTAAATQYPLCTTTTGKRGKRRNLSIDERAKQNRDRNREHARNTRLRKKAYVEELKRTLLAMVAERDGAELRRKVTEEQLREQKEVRFAVMKEFMNYRGRNESMTRWSAILDPNFIMKLPVTPYRKMTKGMPSQHRTTAYGNNNPLKNNQIDNLLNFDSNQRILRGVVEVVTDSKYICSFLEGIAKGHPHKYDTSGSISSDECCDRPTMEFICDRNSFVADGDIAFLKWTATSVGLKRLGTFDELFSKGTMMSNFCPVTNKLKSVELYFDSYPIAQQVQRLIPQPRTPPATLAPGAAGKGPALASQALQAISSSEESEPEGTPKRTAGRKVTRAKSS
mmetsp:Transcript_29251/g.67163  ORF Transcript_29251/g.67163 Transcript_29251/m.67163 type:complete len:557 (+) Transcript_29251:819-2489(+)